MLVLKANSRRQFVPAPQSTSRLAGALAQVFGPAEASFVSGDDLASLLSRNRTSTLGLGSALEKKSPLPELRGIEYLLSGRLYAGPLGFRLDLVLRNAKGGALAATAMGCCETESSLPAEPMLESLGFQVIPGR